MNAPAPTLELRVDAARMLSRLEALADVERHPDGSCCRIALTDADKVGRDIVAGWMRAAGLAVEVDRLGNIFATLPGREAVAPVMTGSHIDTVATGGRYDGAYGVLAGLEAIERIQEAGVKPRRPLCLAVFTNEEGVRFQPDMMGSLVYAGGLSADEALDARASDGVRLGDELTRIGYAGAATAPAPAAFVELHIEQGPVLDRDNGVLGAVEDLQGISWQEVRVTGTSNHAGTTPMALRRDAGHAAARIVVFLRDLAVRMGGAQVATVGALRLSPNLINVIPREAILSVDLRNTDEALLREAEAQVAAFLARLAQEEGVEIAARPLARTGPVRFDPAVVAVIERVAARLGQPIRRMTSGAGHDAQMIARICPAAMIFVPSIGGVSHNPREDTSDAHLEIGANALLQTLLELSA